MKAKVQQQGAAAIKKGSWSPEEDAKLVHIVQEYGHAHWNSLAHAAGLQRTGKSCRLRWMNYLRPNVRHGRFSLEEQLLILHLHCHWGNRWAKIVERLPGRTDNDIKNYWRTRILKHAEHLKCDANSPLFKHAIHHIWIPTLLERIMSGSGSGSGSGSESGSDYISLNHLPINSPQDVIGPQNNNVLELSNGPAYTGTEKPNISNGSTGPLEVPNGTMGFERAQDSQRGIRNKPEFESWVFESSPSELEVVLDDIMFHSDQHTYFDSNPMTSI